MSKGMEQVSTRSANVYASHIRTLEARIFDDRPAGPDSAPELTHERLVDKLIETAPSLQRATRLVRRSAVINFLVSEHEAGKLSEATLNAYKQRIADEMRKISDSETKHNARARARFISKPDYDIMLKWLASRFDSKKTGSLARLVYNYLVASCAVGARPIEWATANWANTERTVLRIYTAKTKIRPAWSAIPALSFTYEDFDQDKLDLTHDLSEVTSHATLDGVGVATADFENRLAKLALPTEELDYLRANRRENGLRLFRDIQVPSPEVQEAVQYMLDAVQHDLYGRDLPFIAPDDLDAVQSRWLAGAYQRIRLHFATMSREAFRDRPAQRYSPADCRSTFAANQKKMHGTAAAARAMGHKKPSTIRNHYAPASSAWPNTRSMRDQAKIDAEKVSQLPKPVQPSIQPSKLLLDRARERMLRSFLPTPA